MTVPVWVLLAVLGVVGLGAGLAALIFIDTWEKFGIWFLGAIFGMVAVLVLAWAAGR